MPLPSLLAQYIVRTEIKVNKCNLKTFCKSCIEVLGEEKGREICNNASQPTSIEPILDINNDQDSDNFNNSRNITNEEAAILIEEEHEIVQDESDNEMDFQLENEFNEYLQNWAEMLEGESIFDENDEDIFKDNIIDNIVHPAVDLNAKWELLTLFKNELNLPF
ncbi:10824_t:CDS:2 [Funneliformis geosporum]|uniref:10824_t:CDS:1 n=1 Tax=Funneliformis geosporum TaxID=1117311 RepID=A0A9W4SD71_9GLOM|nr:10824_t:CDS:2 [Funneliformis geosporum]